MELKEKNSDNLAVGRPICKVYNTPASTPPEVDECPNGKYKEQLFNADWSDAGQRDVVVGSTSNPDPDTPPDPDTLWNPGPPNPGEEPLRNPNPIFYQFKDTLSEDLPFSQLTEDKPAEVEIKTESAGGSPRFGAGNFRVTCQYSHFSYDDPIVKPGEVDGAHLHMFFGKTNTDAFTDEENIADSGGGTCNGFALNRSAYWTPALLDDRDRVVIPKTILVYYKSSRVNKPEGVARMPHGLQLLGGNIMGSAKAIKPSSDSSDVFWSCGANGAESKEAPNDRSRNRKDDTKAGTLSDLECDDDEPINASIYFPQCVARDDAGTIKLKSDDDDVLSHTYRLSTKNSGENTHTKCPASHPVRIPELAILLYYPPQASLDGWKLSSDEMVPGAAPGSTLHADWMGGWEDDTMDLWVEECNRAKLNCTLGQTGTEDNLKRALNGESGIERHRESCGETGDCKNDDWLGPYFVTKPEKRQ